MPGATSARRGLTVLRPICMRSIIRLSTEGITRILRLVSTTCPAVTMIPRLGGGLTQMVMFQRGKVSLGTICLLTVKTTL